MKRIMRGDWASFHTLAMMFFIVIGLLPNRGFAAPALLPWAILAQSLKKKVDTKEPFAVTDVINVLNVVPIPSQAELAFKDLIIRNATYSDKADGFKKGLSVRGTAMFHGAEVSVEVIAVDLAQGVAGGSVAMIGIPKVQAAPTISTGVSIIIEVPRGWRLSEMFDQFKKLNELQMPSGQLIVSTFDYYNSRLKALVKEGLTFVAHVELAGPLKQLEKLIQNLGKGLAVTGSMQAYVQGFIPKNVDGAQFKVIMPAQFGIDFQKLYQAGVMKQPPKLIKQITTGDFIIDLTLPSLAMSAGAGIRFNLVTQDKPIELRAQVVLDPNKAQFEGKMAGVLDPAFVSWLALSNMRAVLGIDYALAPEMIAATGVPFNLIMFEGGFGLGSQSNRVIVDVAAAVSLSSTEPPALILSGGVSKIPLSDVMEFFGRVLSKRGIQPSINLLPDIKLENIKLSIIPVPIEIMKKRYEPGILLQGELDLKRLHGFSRLMVDTTQGRERFLLQAVLEDIKKPYFRFTGEGLPDVKDKFTGPILLMDISAKQQIVYVMGVVEIPLLDIKQGIKCSVTPQLLAGQFKTRLFGVLDAEVELSMPLNDPFDFKAHLQLSSKQDEAIRVQVLAELKRIRNERLAELKKMNDQATVFRQNFEKLKLEVKKSTDDSEVRRAFDSVILSPLSTYDECKLTSPSTWLTQCVRAAWNNVKNKAESLKVGIDLIQDKVKQKLDNKYRSTLQSIEDGVDKLHKELKKISIVTLDGIAYLVEHANAVEFDITADIDGNMLQKGKVPPFTARVTLNIQKQRLSFVISDLDLSGSDRMNKITDRIAQQILEQLRVDKN